MKSVKAAPRFDPGESTVRRGSYDIYIGRSDWGWDQYWAKVIATQLSSAR